MTDEIEMNMYVLSNIPGDESALSLLTMFIDGVLKNQVGIMRAREDATGESVLLLVGVDTDKEGKVKTYPLARVLGAEEGTYYSSPDGLGNFQGATYQLGLGE